MKIYKNILCILVIRMDDEKIDIHVQLSEQEKQIANASFMEIILHYIVNPQEFLIHTYKSIMTMTWKFYF